MALGLGLGLTHGVRVRVRVRVSLPRRAAHPVALAVRSRSTPGSSSSDMRNSMLVFGRGARLARGSRARAARAKGSREVDGPG
eukprot:scaffold29778_cov62-Phaeocystis_antarctica.AAC.1